MPLLGEVQPPAAPATAPTTGPATAPPPKAAAAPARVRLGEELPIFCERCGYSLHGLPQARCERCTVLHYACPECNHHQPINTLRPAAQRILGRVRAFALGFWVLVKLNYFGWLLFAWFVMGSELSYRTQWLPRPATSQPTTAPAPLSFVITGPPLDADTLLPIVVFALPFAMAGRMLLLRWRRGWAVGCVLAALVAAAFLLGGLFRYSIVARWDNARVPPLSPEVLLLAALAAGCVVAGAAVVWGAWMAVVHLFLPQKTAQALLDWQRGLSSRQPLAAHGEPALARE